MIFKFGTGSLFGVNTSGASPQTPRQFGALQNVSIDYAFTNKELYGQDIFPLAIARAQGKVTGKAQSAQVQGGIYNDLFFGPASTTSTGAVLTAINEAHGVPASTPFTVTVINSATWDVDRGVFYQNGNVALTAVASAPTAGEYSVAAGVYTFAAADEGVPVLISYDYTNATGSKIVIANVLQGVAPTFQIKFATLYNGQQATYQLNACVADKLTIPSKMADWNIDELDFSASADNSGVIGQINLPSL